MSEKVTALAGGVGAARLLRGMVQVLSPAELTVIVNTADDTVLHGLHISPDLDTVTYTLAGLNDDERGWGLAGETWNVMDALERIGGEVWFRLGDRDLATHLYRTGRMRAGASLSQVTEEICESLGVKARLLPMSDLPVRTVMTLATGEEIPFQDYFVRRGHRDSVSSVRFDGAQRSTPSPGVLEAIAMAATIVVCPSNPIVSIDPILSVPGIRDALLARREDVVAISPIVAGAAIKGPADRLLEELGHGASVVGVARLYSKFARTLVVDRADADLSAEIESTGLECVVTDTVMHDVADSVRLSAAALDAVKP